MTEAGISPKLSLVAKIAAACDAVGGIEKKGKNEKQNYKYLKAADVAKAIRHEFFERGVILVFDEKEFTQTRSVKTNSGGEMGEFLLKAEVTFYDGDSDAKLGPFGAFGVAMDTGDKAIWKAKTGALKYILRGIGLIPDEKDDPEADGRVDEETSNVVGDRIEQAESRFQQNSGKVRASAAIVNAFKATFEKSGKTESQLKQILATRYSAERPDQLTSEEVSDLVKWVVSSEPLESVLKTSVEAVSSPVAASQNDQSKSGTKKLTDKQVGRLFAIAKSHGKPEADIRQYVKESYGIEHLPDMTPLQYNHVCAWAETV